jgi:uncharacterized protein
MRFWDSSAVVPLLVNEPTLPRLLDLLAEDRDIVLWWGTGVECVSALARRERDGAIDGATTNAALSRLRTLTAAAYEVGATEAVRTTAARLLRVHDLRAADALQLGAALIAAENDPGSLGFVCLDRRLGAAALREGFDVVG